MCRTLDSSARARLLKQLTLKLWLAANTLLGGCVGGSSLLSCGNFLFFVQLFRIFYSLFFRYTCPSCCLCCLRATLKESDRNLRFTTPFSIFFWPSPPSHISCPCNMRHVRHGEQHVIKNGTTVQKTTVNTRMMAYLVVEVINGQSVHGRHGHKCCQHWGRYLSTP